MALYCHMVRRRATLAAVSTSARVLVASRTAPTGTRNAAVASSPDKALELVAAQASQQHEQQQRWCRQESSFLSTALLSGVALPPPAMTFDFGLAQSASAAATAVSGAKAATCTQQGSVGASVDAPCHGKLQHLALALGTLVGGHAALRQHVGAQP
mmetsp:Transcript_148271/g.369644  ORF Transcript_148271/g.369644 Transcript_148271/m.369644 type:complete len:156 (+) Transcript_148271:96-563(+)